MVAALEPVTSGTILVSSSPNFALIESTGLADGDAAALLLMASRSDASSLLGTVGVGSPVDLVIRLIIATAVARGVGAGAAAAEELVQTQRVREHSLTALAEIRSEHDSLKALLNEVKSSEVEAAKARSESWAEQCDLFNSEWAKLKLVYDTELGLRAPTTYWTARAKAHLIQAVSFGAAFALCISALLFVFVLYGVPHLAGQARDQQIVSALLPILVPAFAGVWILRMLGRLLSESLQLMRDAKERETLVKTFLALMKDESTGKSVVKEEDRILILHSLFRASAVVAPDDSPPVHWFDVLATKVGKK